MVGTSNSLAAERFCWQIMYWWIICWQNDLDSLATQLPSTVRDFLPDT